MKERPILMNGAMVRATLAGTKSQTRRVMSTQLVYGDVCGIFPSWYLPNKAGTGGTLYPNGKEVILAMCPYGEPGDRLWVRETWRTDATLNGRAPSDFHGWPVKYDADGAVLGHGAHFGKADGKTRVSIHMPRWASRILLEIVSVRVERLNDCSEADALAEGVKKVSDEFYKGLPAWVGFDGAFPRPDAYTAYYDLWESINGAGSWDENPWVWVVEFKRVTP